MEVSILVQSHFWVTKKQKLKRKIEKVLHKAASLPTFLNGHLHNAVDSCLEFERMREGNSLSNATTRNYATVHLHKINNVYIGSYALMFSVCASQGFCCCHCVQMSLWANWKLFLLCSRFLNWKGWDILPALFAQFSSTQPRLSRRSVSQTLQCRELFELRLMRLKLRMRKSSHF